MLNRQRKIEREQEAVDELDRKQKNKDRKVAMAVKQEKLDVDAKVMKKDQADDKKKRFDFLLNSPAGDLFKKFVEASSPSKKAFGKSKVSMKVDENVSWTTYITVLIQGFIERAPTVKPL